MATLTIAAQPVATQISFGDTGAMPSSRKPTGKTRDLLPAAAKARTVELEKKVPRPLSATTLRAIQREPAKGGSYSVLKTKEPTALPVCEVVVTTNAVHIDVGGKKLVLSPTEARVLAGKLKHALN